MTKRKQGAPAGNQNARKPKTTGHHTVRLLPEVAEYFRRMAGGNLSQGITAGYQMLKAADAAKERTMNSNSLAETRQKLFDLTNHLSGVNQYFPAIDATDNGTMTAVQRDAMRAKLDRAEALIDEVRKQLFDEQK